MKRTGFKVVVWIVLLAFVSLLQVSEAPLRAATGGGGSGDGAVASPDEGHFIEKEQEEPARAGRKKFPWLVVAATVVVAAAVVYLVVANKKYTLTASVGEGVTGTPAAGSASHKKNKTVAYSYSLQSGYRDLVVTLDGAPVSASGTVKMDRDHALAAHSTPVAIVEVKSTPGGAAIFDNGSDTGRTTDAVFVYSSAGPHDYLLRRCGYQDHEARETADMGALKTVSAALVRGIYDSFSLADSGCWKPHTASEWTVSGGVYRFASDRLAFNSNVFNVPFNSASMTAEVKMKRVLGDVSSDNAVVLIDRMEGDKAYAYWFSYAANGKAWWIVRLNGWDLYRAGGRFRVLGYGKASMVVTGLNQWNTLKVVRSGSVYSFFINGTRVKTVNDDTYNPHYLALGVILQKKQTEMHYDYVRLDLSAAAAEAPDPADAETLGATWYDGR